MDVLRRRAQLHRLKLFAGLCSFGVGAAALLGWVSSERAAAVSFDRDVQPLFTRSCMSCHPASFPYLDLRPGHAYTGLVRVQSRSNPAFELVLPGRPELSYLLTHHPDPSNAKLLSDEEKRLIERWIVQGAKRR